MKRIKFSLGKLICKVIDWVIETVIETIGIGCIVIFLIAQTDPYAYKMIDALRTKNLTGIFYDEKHGETWQFRRDVLVVYNVLGIPVEILKFSVFKNTIYCMPINSSMEEKNTGKTPPQLIMRMAKSQNNDLTIYTNNGDTCTLKRRISADTLFRKINTTDGWFKE